MCLQIVRTPAPARVGLYVQCVVLFCFTSCNFSLQSVAFMLCLPYKSQVQSHVAVKKKDVHLESFLSDQGMSVATW